MVIREMLENSRKTSQIRTLKTSNWTEHFKNQVNIEAVALADNAGDFSMWTVVLVQPAGLLEMTLTIDALLGSSDLKITTSCGRSYRAAARD